MADPFACFGGDSDDDSDAGDTIEGSQNEQDNASATKPKVGTDPSTDEADAAASSRDKALQLMESFNSAKKDKKATASDQPIKNDHAYTKFTSSYEDQQARTSSLPWRQCPPLYLGPIFLSNTLAEGGGRGYVASQDLPPGTCVLVEEPMVKGWSSEQVGKRLGLESIQYLLEMENAKSIIGCMEELHPRKENVHQVFADGSPETLDRIQIVDLMSEMNKNTSHAQQVTSLVAYAKEHNITNFSDGSPLDARDINRLLLTLRYNGFDSGLYLHFSMFNHSEDPNCIKFRPSTDEGGEEVGYYSEARTTRHVKEGEALSLHYLENPREVSHATRRKILWDQHRFDIGDEDDYKQFLDVSFDKTGDVFNNNERGNNIFESELVFGKFPVSTQEGAVGRGQGTDEADNLPAASNIENSLDDLEDMLVELQAIFMVQSANGGSNNTDGTYFDRVAALELTIGELILASRSALGNNYHILLSRCYRLHIDVIELILTHCSFELTEKQSIELMARFLPSVQQLLVSQRRRLGNDHPDVARTYNDVAMGIQALLSHSPKRLVSLKLEGMQTLDYCSKMEYHCRMEKKRIEEYYPKDVDVILSSVQKKE